MQLHINYWLTVTWPWVSFHAFVLSIDFLIDFTKSLMEFIECVIILSIATNSLHSTMIFLSINYALINTWKNWHLQLMLDLRITHCIDTNSATIDNQVLNVYLSITSIIESIIAIFIGLLHICNWMNHLLIVTIRSKSMMLKNPDLWIFHQIKHNYK